MNSQRAKILDLEKAIEKVASDASATLSSSNRRILVVEDEAGILQAYRDILTPAPNVIKLKSSRSREAPETSAENQSDNFDVCFVSSGEEAIEKVELGVKAGQTFAMGYFDVLLGAGIDGIETVKRIHQLDPQMYAILVTAYQDRHVNSIDRVFGKEFQDRWDYLNKPFSQGEILQKARNMVSMWNIRKQEQEFRKRLDEMKSKASENERLFMIAALARNISHEFGNIVFQIMGRAELALLIPDQEAKKALQDILLSSEHAKNILMRFKDFGRPAEQLNSNFQEMSIEEPLNETLLLVGSELISRNIQVTNTVKDFPRISLNKTGLVQVFMNIIINAAHAIKNDGKLYLAGAVHSDRVEVTIRDSGPGIPPAHMEEIFKTFFTTKGDNGTGLGLGICREIVEVTHGGALSVRNHPEGGAEFLIVIPRKE